MAEPPADRFAAVEALFAAAVDLPPEARTALLDARGAGGDLRDEVERLLRAHDKSGGFLEELDRGRAGELLRTGHAGLHPGVRLGPYQIVRLLGRGGMGEVWLARDARLDRDVALKLLPPWLSGDPVARRRLMDEARAASALDHPNIATVYDVGETAEGGVFIAMAYCDSGSLAERIARGPVPEDEATRYLADIAEGLAAAHARGIVHRDIKPGNIMLTSTGVARIVDFGLARSAGQGATQTGVVHGTVAYMSPGQTLGDPADPRDDVWATGVLLHELLTGELPFRADSPHAAIYSIRHQAVTVPATVAAEQAAVIARCLAKDPGARYADGGALLAALQAQRSGASASRVRAPWIVAVVATLALIIVGVWSWRGREDAGAIARLAVLPVVNLSQDPADDYLADGITDELISRLTALAGLQVIARTSVVQYRENRPTVAEVARDLRVGSVLEGTLRRSGERLLVTMRLVDVSAEAPRWSEQWEAGVEDLLGIQRTIAERVATALLRQLSEVERARILAPETADPEAHLSYLRGRQALHRRSAEGLTLAVSYFSAAIARDSVWAAPWAGRAEAWLHLGNYGFRPVPVALMEARRSVAEALRRDADRADALAVDAMLRVADLDLDSAAGSFAAAVDRRPGDALVRHWHGFFLGMIGRVEDGLTSLRIAADLDPLSLAVVSSLARLLVHAGELGSARTVLTLAVEFDPDYPWTWHALGLVHVAAGDMAAARQAFETAAARAPGQPRLAAAVAAARAALGEPAPARALLGPSPFMTAPHMGPYERALLWAMLGERGRAFEELHEVPWNSEHLFALRTDPMLEPLRGDPRYGELLRSLGLQSQQPLAP